MARVESGPVLEDFEELFVLLERIMEEDEKGMTFYEDVKERAESMVQWITENNVATDNHQRAVDNWKDAIEEKLARLS